MARRSFKKDKGIKALHEGKRISSNGNTYYEYRKNRSDKDRRKKFENGGGVGGYYVEFDGENWQSVFPENESQNSQLHSSKEEAIDYMVNEFGIERNNITIIDEMKNGGGLFGTSRSKSALAKDHKYFNKNEKHEVQYAKRFKRRKKTYDKYENGGGVEWSNDENEALGKWLLSSKDGNEILKKAKNSSELENLVRDYANKKGGVAGLEIDNEDEGLEWVTFSDLWKEIKENKTKYSNGGGVGNSFGEIYNRVVQYIIDKEDMSREDAVELVDSKETWLRDMIEFHEEYDTETLAEGITSDMGEMKRGGIFGFGTSRSKSALAKDRKYFNKNEKHEVQYAKTFKRRKKTYDKYEKGGGVDEEFDIDEKVIVNGKEGNIVSMLGKETKDPNELDWYEIKFNDGSSDHYPVTEIKKYSNGGGVGDFENEPLYLVKYITTDGNVHEHTLASYGEGSKDDILETLNKYTLNGKNVSVLKLMSIKRMDNVMNGIYANGGGVGCGCTMRKPLPKLEYKYGGELTDENMVRENLINGEIHSDILSEIIGRKPNYPNEIVGAIVLTKCFLRPYYRIS